MSRGCFQVIGYEHVFERDDEEDEVGIVRIAGLKHTFIPKKDIVSVRCFSTQQDYCSGKFVHLYAPNCHFNMVQAICTLNNAEVCSCGANANTRKIYSECTCNLSVFPLYEIVTKNKMLYQMEKRNHEHTPVYPVITNLVTYIVHSSEREHMERYLAGTDDALYDYVHHLKYNPTNGSEALVVKDEFEMRQQAGKRLKVAN